MGVSSAWADWLENNSEAARGLFHDGIKAATAKWVEKSLSAVVTEALRSTIERDLESEAVERTVRRMRSLVHKQCQQIEMEHRANSNYAKACRDLRDRIVAALPKPEPVT